MKDFGPTHKTVIVCVLIAAMAGLALVGKGFDTVGLLAVLAGLGWVAVSTQATQQNTNGNMTQLMAMVQDLTDKISRLPALPPDPPSKDQPAE